MAKEEEAVTELDAPALKLVSKRLAATVTWADSEGEHQVPLKGRMVLGSSEQAPLRLSHPRVSRVHAELELDNQGVTVRDLGSTNGTWLGTVKVQQVRLRETTSLRFGAASATVRFEDAPESVPLWPQDRLGPMIGRCEPMRELFLTLSSAARSDASVLVHGETGTGKELVAAQLHELSPRANGPFVVVDCAALPETLLEAELFGHEKGAFTGAATARAGAIEQAEGGTVFFDEIGELPLPMQPKLLRVLESRTVRRLGQHAHTAVDVRFIAATHRDLSAMVARGEFREDLFFRLSVLPLEVPPLRNRGDDLELLLRSFLGAKWAELTPETVKELLGRRWPGNVRELRTFAERVGALGIERALELLRGATSAPPQSLALPPGSLPPVDTSLPFKELRERWVDHLEREYIKSLMAKHGRDVGSVADAAGLDRSYVHRLIRKHGI